MGLGFGDGGASFLNWDSVTTLTQPISFACWCFRDVEAIDTVLGHGDAASTDELWELQLSNIGVPLFRRVTGGNPSNAQSGLSPPREWFHYAGVQSAADNAVCFTDGDVGVTNTNTSVPSGADRITVGAAPGLNNPNDFTGRVFWPAIWDTALTDEEVQILANGVHPYYVRRDSLVFFAVLIDSANPTAIRDLAGARTVSSVTGTPVFTPAPPGLRYKYENHRSHKRTSRTLM